jgi:hypothetical protein
MARYHLYRGRAKQASATEVEIDQHRAGFDGGIGREVKCRVEGAVGGLPGLK